MSTSRLSKVSDRIKSVKSNVITEELFSAMSTLRLAREKMKTGGDLRCLYTGTQQMARVIESVKAGVPVEFPAPVPEPLEVVIFQMVNDALNAYDRARGCDHLIPAE